MILKKQIVSQVKMYSSIFLENTNFRNFFNWTGHCCLSEWIVNLSLDYLKKNHDQENPARITTGCDLHNASHSLFASGGDEIEFFPDFISVSRYKKPVKERQGARGRKRERAPASHSNKSSNGISCLKDVYWISTMRVNATLRSDRE